MQDHSTTLPDTPAIVLDLAAVERNLARAQVYADLHGIRLRPHVKTHKSVLFARRQVELGAIGITCQKLGEAEVMADGGIADILLSFPIVGEAKLARLVSLARRVTLATVCDSLEVAEGLAHAVRKAGVRLNVLVECDTGGARCGVQSPAEAASLAASIAGLDGLTFGGLMTYPPREQIATTASFLRDAIAATRQRGVDVPVVSVGGTPDVYRAHELGLSALGVQHEHRPGTYLFSDRYMLAYGVNDIEDCAMRVHTTVVSRPTADRAIIDAGSKVFSSDLMGFADHGIVLGYPEASLAKLSEEHGHLDVSRCARKPVIGERLVIVPNHACAVTNLASELVGVRGAEARFIPVDARGRVS
jgi:D-serine deaminase-like pyridoxal phosphate-dependent protein